MAALLEFPEFASTLCIVAHPDDLEYGAASAVARWTSEGKRVAYALVTAGEAGIDGMAPDEAGAAREAEERASAAVVGVDDVEFLGHRDGVVTYGLELRRDVARVVRRHRPDVVVTGHMGLRWPTPDGLGALNMADHRNVGLAVLDGVRDAGNRWIFPELVDEGYEPWAGTRWVALANSTDATHGVDVGDYLDRGVASLRAHEVYLAGLGDAAPDPDEMLRGFAEAAGVRFGVDYAVGFELIHV